MTCERCGKSFSFVEKEGEPLRTWCTDCIADSFKGVYDDPMVKDYMETRKVMLAMDEIEELLRSVGDTDHVMPASLLMQVQNQLDGLAGGSGHLTSFQVISDTFKHSSKHKNPVTFSLEAYRISEFSSMDEGDTRYRIEGSFDLDAGGSIAKDAEGKPIFKFTTVYLA
ncbi:MAG TPA: hypothetical protein DCE41_15515 [Cytophagales bacterium]|nr:hypothetical protein [Cytophagales bacterium]